MTTNKYYTLKEIWQKMAEFLDNYPDLYNIVDECPEWDAFDELQDSIFNDNQYFFSWDLDNGFRIDKAFDSVLYDFKNKNIKLKDYLSVFHNDRLYVLLETEE